MVTASLLTVLALLASPQRDSLSGPWRATLDLAGGELRFGLQLRREGNGWKGTLCNATECQPFSAVRWAGDSLRLELGDYAAAITAVVRKDSLVGSYHNVGRRGPRSIPFRATRGRWEPRPPPAGLAGRWDAWFQGSVGSTPRVLEFRDGPKGLEGTIISNSGDYGAFGGQLEGDSIALAHFDGSFVYLLTAHLVGDTLSGTFHAGLRSQTPFVAVRSTGRPHLTPPTDVTRADTSAPFSFEFPDLAGRPLRADAERFRGKVVLVEIFGTWCPTCHDAAESLVDLYRRYHGRGLEIVGIAFEVTGDSAIDGALVRRYRDKFGISYPLLLGGISETETVEAALPQLEGFTAYPTIVFLGRDRKVRRVHAGFYGRATGAQHGALERGCQRAFEPLRAEPAPA